MDRHNRGDLREEGEKKKKKKTIEPRENKKLERKLIKKKGSREMHHMRCGDRHSTHDVLTHSVVVM